MKQNEGTVSLTETFLWGLWALSLSLGLAIMPKAKAQTTVEELRPEAKKFSGLNRTLYTAGLKKDETGTNSAGLQSLTYLGYQLTPKQKATLFLSFSKDLRGEKKEKLDDGELRWRFKQELRQGITLAQEARTKLAWSESSRDNTSLQAAVTYTPDLSLDLEELIQLKNLSFVYKPYFTRNFHQFKTARKDGSSNNRFQITNLAELNYSPWEKISLGLGGYHVMAWSYNNVRKIDNFSLYQELGVQFNQTLLLVLGHSNKGGVLKADRQSDNVALFDQKTSEVYADLNISF